MPNPLIKQGTISPASFRLPDGRNPENVRLSQLYAALVALRIPNISAEMGKHLLLERYHAHLLAVIASTPKARRRPDHLVPDSEVHAAIAQIGRDAA